MLINHFKSGNYKLSLQQIPIDSQADSDNFPLFKLQGIKTIQIK